MKSKMSFSLAIVVILCAGSMCMAQEKTRQKKQGVRAKASAEQKAWQAKLEKMTPEQQKVARAKKAFEASVTPWHRVRQIAAQEKATKTLAAIDHIIAAKQKQFNTRMAAQQKGKARPQAATRKQAAARKQAGAKKPAQKKNVKKDARQARPKKKTQGKK